MGRGRQVSLWLPVAAVGGFILYASVRTVVPVEAHPIPHFDKVLHAGAYGLLALTLARALGSGVCWWWAAVVSSSYGAALEVVQGFIGRNPSVADAAANAAGAVLAAWVWRVWEKRVGTP